MLDFRIMTFLEVCRTMNYTKAAENLNLTQPAVSQHIHWLEQQYGVKVFSYINKNLYLTEEGKQLQSAFKTMSLDISYLADSVKHKKRVLTFGTTPTVGTYLIPEPLKRYKDKFPDTNIFMHVRNTADLCRMIDDNVIDFAIVEGYVQKSDYSYLLYRSEKYLPVCSASFDITDKVKKMSDLLAFPLLIREKGSGNRDIIVRSLSRYNLSPEDFQSIIEINDIQAIKAMIAQGIGIGFLYHSAVKDDIASGKLKEIPLEDFDESHEFTFIWRKNSIYSEQFEKLFELLKPR